METPAKTALGGSLIAALTISSLVAMGVAADPSAPPAGAATGLTTFQDCAALKAWYVDHTIDQVGPYGWGGQRWMTMREGAPTAATPDADAKAAVPNGSTGTNTQEVGVDEPDVAKTNGRIVVRLTDNRRLVITDVSGASPHQIASWSLPDRTYVDGLLLVGDHVLLAGGQPMDLHTFADDRVLPGPIYGSAGAELLDLDISDPAHPVLDSRTSWSGRQLSLRQYGDRVRLVTSTGLPALRFVQPRPGQLDERTAEQRNREILRASRVEDWVPGITSGSRSGPLVGCSEVYHPKTWSGSDTVAVTTFRPGAMGSAVAVAVTGAGSEVYSSDHRLYVTSTDWGRPVLVDSPMSSTHPQPAPVRPISAPRTDIHAFALQGDTTRYLASGSIDGTLRDRWSLDEYGGHLRVAVSWPDRQGGVRDNGIVVLDEHGGRLEQVGALRGLGADEQLQSVRWFDDLAVLVTFRQMDPLYTVDLADPTHPRRLGSLKVPGFSSYLHPIGGHRLLGIGTGATTDGRSLGAQVGVFDIGDPAHARQVGRVAFGQGSSLLAADDPHAFTWLPDASAAITGLQSADTQTLESPSPGVGRAGGMVVLRVSPSGTLSIEDLPSPGGAQPRALPLDGGRVALVGTTVRIVHIG